MSQLELIAEDLEFPEGPIALRDGSVLVVEIKAGTLSRVWPDGKVERLVEIDGGPNGAQVGPDGRIYLCNNGGFRWLDGSLGNARFVPLGRAEGEAYIGGRIQAVDLRTGAVETLYTECAGNPLLAPNDIVFDQHGGIYFTDTGTHFERSIQHGGLYYCASDGSYITEIAFPLSLANGVGMSPDFSRVYVSESGRAMVWAWDVESPGVMRQPAAAAFSLGVGGGTLLAGLGGEQMFDSLGVDSEGNVCVATLITGAISVISPAGVLLDVIELPWHDPLTTNICFGGPDLRTAYITAGGTGRLYRMPWHCPGAEPAFTHVEGIDP